MTTPARVLGACGGAAAGAVLALVGGFFVLLRLGGAAVPLTALAAPLLLLLGCRLLATAAGRTTGVALAVGWLLTTVVLTQRGPGGDLVLGADPRVLVYLAAGTVAAGAGAVLAATARGGSSGAGQVPRPQA